jgi:predicted RNase H-like HicB family nuclease
MATRERRRVEDFLDLPYAIAVARNEDGWTARVEELEGCEATGASPDEAAAAVRAAMGDWIGAALAAGRPVPTPRATATHSGRLLVRMRPDLHAELARLAEREQTSMNALIVGILDHAVRARDSAQPAPRPEPAPAQPAAAEPAPRPAQPAAPAPPADRTRLLSLALKANLVIVVVAAAVAVGLLVLAWQGA